MKKEFSNWYHFSEVSEIDKRKFPGIYLIRLSKHNLSGFSFEWSEEIIYIGMTNSIGGLKSRLYQFETTLKGKDSHGGAHRVRFKYPDHEKLLKNLYVSVFVQECDVKSNSPEDLRKMGVVEQFEYECFARFVEKFNRLPEFNDKKRSPKK